MLSISYWLFDRMIPCEQLGIMWLILKVHKETSELFIQTAQFVFRAKSRFVPPSSAWLEHLQYSETWLVLSIHVNYKWNELLDLDTHVSIYHFKNDKNWSRLITAITEKSLESLFVNSYLPNPSPQPHKQQWTSASRFFSLVSTLYRGRERELQEDFEKDALFY